MCNHRKRCISALLALALILCLALPAFAQGDKAAVIRVGYYHSEGYSVMDANGVRSGYVYEILQAMKRYNHWTYEYVGYDKGWPDIQQMLTDGDIDMAVSAVKTPARMEIFDFSARPIGQSGACLIVQAGESPYVAGQYDTYEGMRIGFIENAAQIASTEAFAKDKGFTYEPVYYKTSSDLTQAIHDGVEVDAIVTSNLRIIPNVRRLDMFAMQDIHIMVQKGNAQLLRQIDHALEQISLYNPGLYDDLYDKYYALDVGDKVFYTPEESAFIAQCAQDDTPLHVAFMPDMAPYAWFEDGKPTGILYDIATEILYRTGLKWQLLPAENDADYRALVDQKKADIWLTARFDYHTAETLGYVLTDPYYIADVSRITLKAREGDLHSIAVVEGSLIETHYLPTVLAEEAVTRLPSVEDCVDAVLSGRCDAAYLFTHTAQKAVYADITNRLTSVVMPKYSTGFSIGVLEDTPPHLATILQKAAFSLTEDDKAELVLHYTDYGVRSMSLLGMLYNNPLLVIALVTLVFVALIIIVTLVFLLRRRRLERVTNKQLQEALDIARQANAAKSTFMSRMSHEIRTPLNAIIGYNAISSAALAKAENEAEYRHSAMKAMDCLLKSDIASKHLLTVINDVLDMSAIESGKIKIAHEPFDFKDIISALTVMFYSQADAQGLSFEVMLDPDLDEWYIGDQMRINQILTNLLSNAVKFTPAGGSVCLNVRKGAVEGKAAKLHFEISDTGIGMSKEYMMKIWVPFEQEDASISRRFGGTGLGLSITKNLVDLMKGEIDVDSQTGVGTTFHVTLTLESMTQPEADTPYDFSGINMLVADDDPSTCEYIALLLARVGAKCRVVHSGTQAVAAIAEAAEKGESYTACIIDWRMPEADGLVTVKRIRDIAGPGLPLIIISAYDFTEIEEDAKQAGVVTFLAKPLFQSTVFNLLAEIAGKDYIAPVSTQYRADFGGMRIMLVEDNAMNMEIAKAVLASWGFTVDQAWNGVEAVSMFMAAPPGSYKAILMDVHMPEMDGYNATMTIRAAAHEDAATVPIIAMTADVFAEDVAEALASGMNGHIGKPIDRDALLDILIKLIKR